MSLPLRRAAALVASFPLWWAIPWSWCQDQYCGDDFPGFRFHGYNLFGTYLSVPFLKAGFRLEKVSDGSMPYETSLKLYLTGQATKLQIRQLNDLMGYVTITGAPMALEYVRLATSADTQFLFQSQFIEVFQHPKVLNGTNVLPPDTWRRLGLRPLKITTRGSVFLIERNVLSSERKIYRFTERVTGEGGYAVLRKVVVVADPSKVPLVFPLHL